MANKSRSRQIHKILKKRVQVKYRKKPPFINYKSRWDLTEVFDHFEIKKRKAKDRESTRKKKAIYDLIITNIRKELHRFWFAKNDFNFSTITFKITSFSPKIKYYFETKQHYYTLENSKGAWKLWINSKEVYVFYIPRGGWTTIDVKKSNPPYFKDINRHYNNETLLNTIEDLNSVLQMLVSLRDFDVTNKIISSVEDLYS